MTESNKGKVWFAKKLNGDIIFLTELEALIHFEENNIANRMRLEFLGTSDGRTFDRIINEAKLLKGEEREAKVKEAFAEELKVAKANGVQEPDRTLRIITQGESGQKVHGKDREKMLRSMGGMI